MKPNRTSWNSGMPNASTKVARSRRRWRNSFWKIARNDAHMCSRRLSVARRRRLLGQGHEDVFERRLDGANRGAREAGRAQLLDDLLVGDGARDLGVHGLP